MEFEKYFSSVDDPRDIRKINHLLTDIIGLSIIGVIAGCENYDDIEEFGKEKVEWLKQYLYLHNGIPSHDTIQRVFESINPKEFSKCFMEWTFDKFDLESEDLYHIDGKSNRRSMDSFRNQKMLHAVNVFAGRNKLCLYQMKVDDKTNEITAIPSLIEVLDIQDKTITIDAMGCQKNIAEKIIQQGGNYILAVKGNQKELEEEIESAFERGDVADTHKTIEKDHGRIEERICKTKSNLTYIDETIYWKGLTTVIMIQSKRTIGEKTTEETRYFISNLKETASWFLSAIRSHWGIENNLHWVLDMVFDEDACRKRKDNAAENFNIIRKSALNIIKNYKGDKRSLRRRRLNAAWNQQYLEQLLKS